MKVYLYNVDNGVFAGETFEDADMLVNEDGVTTIPPPAHAHGQVPVFDRHTKQWVVIPVTTARQLLNL
jgi:hypothetical protein